MKLKARWLMLGVAITAVATVAVLAQSGPGSVGDVVQQYQKARRELTAESDLGVFRRTWIDRLAEAARANPDDFSAAFALREAARMAGLLDDTEESVKKSRELYEACAACAERRDPPDDLMLAECLRHLAMHAARDCRMKGKADVTREDIARVFAAYDKYAGALRQLSPNLLEPGSMWSKELNAIVLKKAQFVASLYGPLDAERQNGWVPQVPCGFEGVQASELYQTWLDRVEAGEIPAGNKGIVNVLNWQLIAFVKEGRRSKAVENYRKLFAMVVAHPEEWVSPIAQITRGAQALDPRQGAFLRYWLEKAEREVPLSEAEAVSLSWKIAMSYLGEDVPDGFIERMEPVLLSDKPEHQEWKGKMRDQLLFWLAEAYNHHQVRRYEEAARLYRTFLREFPREANAASARQALAHLRELGVIDRMPTAEDASAKKGVGQ